MKIVIRSVSGMGRVKDYSTHPNEETAKREMVKLKKWFLGKGWVASVENPYVLEKAGITSTLTLYMVDVEGIDGV